MRIMISIESREDADALEAAAATVGLVFEQRGGIYVLTRIPQLVRSSYVDENEGCSSPNNTEGEAINGAVAEQIAPLSSVS